MSIKTNELQQIAAPQLTDTLLLASSAGGTAQLPLAQAAAFFGAEMVKAGNPVGAALSNKAALSAQEAVELASPVKRTVRLEASGLQNYLDRLPRLLTEYLTLEVSGELSSAVEIRDFYGPGNLTVVSSSGGFTSRGIRVTHCSVFVYLKNIAFQEREDMTPNDALLAVPPCGHFVQVV